MTTLTDSPVAGIDDQRNANHKLMIALDVDGTLVDHDGHMSPGVREAARGVVAQGHDVLIATGRSLNATLPVIEQIGVERGYAVGCNGGVKLGSGSSIEYYTGFTTGKPYPTDRTNEWKAKNRYGRAYVDGDEDPVIEFDLFLGDTGMPREMFIDNLEIWTDIMADFDRFVFVVKTNAKKK